MWEVNANATSVKGMLNGTDHLGLRLIVFMQEAGGFGFLDCYKFNVSPGLHYSSLDKSLKGLHRRRGTDLDFFVLEQSSLCVADPMVICMTWAL
nr:hypothetical protein CFP56_49281 [Quercus suber]